MPTKPTRQAARRKTAPARPKTAPGAGSRPGGGRSRSRASEMNILLIVLTVLYAIVCWFLEKTIYKLFADTMALPLLIGILFLIFVFFLSIFVFAYSCVSGIFEQNYITGGDAVSAIPIILIGSLLVFCFAALFQWIYQLNFSSVTTKATSYIFLIDESGSMSSSDPDNLRYDGVEEVLADEEDDFPYMVYAFDDTVTIIRDMAPISEGVSELASEGGGGTAIKGVLTQVLDDYEAAVWEGGDAPKVILLTDGWATDVSSGLFGNGLGDLLDEYAAKGITVSTVGLGSVDSTLLQQIADTTGGVFVDISDAADLSSALKTAAINYSRRDLLSKRYAGKMNVLYGILRVLFLAVLGFVTGMIVVIAYGRPEEREMTIIATIITAVLGAVLMEIGTQITGISSTFMWLVMWILFALTIASKTGSYRRPGTRRSLG